MNCVPVVDILSGKYSSKSVVVNGWVRSRRDSRAGMSFLDVYDGSCLKAIQAVIPENIANYDDIVKLTTGCSVSVKGRVVDSPARKQSFEIYVEELKVLGQVDSAGSYPIAKNRHSVEYLREFAHLRPRTNLIGAVARVRNCLYQAVHRFYNENGFLWVSTPVITASDAEGAGEMFRVSTRETSNLQPDEKGDLAPEFFGKETFLTVSGQLNAEAYACAMSKVYAFGPTFRAENSNTSRHLAEFWMVEPEVAFADLEDIVQLAQDMMVYLLKAVLAERHEDLDFFARHIDKTVIDRLEQFSQSDFVQIEYTDAIEILLKSGKIFEFPVEWGKDMFSEHERYLAEQYFQSPVIVKNYPKNIRPFYVRMNDDGRTVAAMDFLAPGVGEIIGGSQREERLSILDKRMVEKGIRQESMSWYRDLRRYGTVPHSGFGLGFERLVSYVTGVANVRDVIPFPRYPRSANF